MDGNDVFEVYRVSKYAIEKARGGQGPILIESKTMRMKGHAEHDDASYVPKQQFIEWQKKDPILRAEKYLLDEKIISENQLIINCTPLGMHPHPDEFPPIPYRYITNQHLMYDLLYNPPLTLFLKKGEEKGAVIKNGEEMLELQAEESWRIWN